MEELCTNIDNKIDSSSSEERRMHRSDKVHVRLNREAHEHVLPLIVLQARMIYDASDCDPLDK